MVFLKKTRTCDVFERKPKDPTDNPSMIHAQQTYDTPLWLSMFMKIVFSSGSIGRILDYLG